MNIGLYVLIGLGAGVLSGLVGVGGGIVIVPALVLLFGFTQHRAQGTTLATLVPPIGLLAAWQYYRQGDVDIKVALLIAAGFVAGGFFGAEIATTLSSPVLTRVFAVVLVAIGTRMFITG